MKINTVERRILRRLILKEEREMNLNHVSKSDDKVKPVTGVRRIVGYGQSEPKVKEVINKKHIDFNKCMSQARMLDSGNVPVTVENVLMTNDLSCYYDAEIKRLSKRLSDRYSKEKKQNEYYMVSDRGAYLSVTTIYR